MIKLVIMDVDGTLTDGSIYYSDDQTEIKKFNVKDAAGIMACQSVGKKCVILTGRESYAVVCLSGNKKQTSIFEGFCWSERLH